MRYRRALLISALMLMIAAPASAQTAEEIKTEVTTETGDARELSQIDAETRDVTVAENVTVKDAADVSIDDSANVAAPVASNNDVIVNDAVDVGDVNVLSSDDDSLQDNDVTQDNDTLIDNSQRNIDRSFNRDSIVDADVVTAAQPAAVKRAAVTFELDDLEVQTSSTNAVSGKTLPFTGFPAAELAQLAAALIVSGAAMIFIGRKRQLAAI